MNIHLSGPGLFSLQRSDMFIAIHLVLVPAPEEPHVNESI